MKSIDETTILRFASGEMDADEEATFLARCEIWPGAWRETVLAVAEHRRVVEALRGMAVGEGESESLCAPSAANRRVRHWFAAPALVAASLLVGLLLGIGGARITGLGVGGSSPVVQAGPAGGTSLPETVDAAPANLAELLRMPPIIPESRRVALENEGFQVKEQPTLYVIDTENGTRWAVPTQEATVHYVKQ